MKKPAPPPLDEVELEPLKPGTVVAEKFLIKRLLAEGAMGQVYVATQEPMGREVALKLMLGTLDKDVTAVKRFFQEAVAISKLRHPNTITLFDFGRSPEGQLYLAMELVQGKSLQDVLAEKRKLGLERTVRILSQVALSLAEAHREAVIHRDLKPANILLTDLHGHPDFVKVIDFGIAQLGEADRRERITEVGRRCGTPIYMSPEQLMRGKVVDRRSDLFTLGVIMYQMLEGRYPFPADTTLGILDRKYRGEPDPMSETVPKSIRDFIRRLMRPEPDERPDTAEQFLLELQAALPPGIRLNLISLGRPNSEAVTTRIDLKANPIVDMEKLARGDPDVDLTDTVIDLRTLTPGLETLVQFEEEALDAAGGQQAPAPGAPVAVAPEASVAPPAVPLGAEPETISDATSRPRPESFAPEAATHPPRPMLSGAWLLVAIALGALLGAAVFALLSNGDESESEAGAAAGLAGEAGEGREGEGETGVEPAVEQGTATQATSRAVQLAPPPASRAVEPARADIFAHPSDLNAAVGSGATRDEPTAAEPGPEHEETGPSDSEAPGGALAPAGEAEADLPPIRERPVADVPIGNLPRVSSDDREEPSAPPGLPQPLGAICTADVECASSHCDLEHCAPRDYDYIPAGSFWMGRDEPDEPDEQRHFVTITRPFFMSRYEVTQGEWQALMERLHTDRPDCDACPAEDNRWEKAAEYLNALSRREGLEPCYQIDGDDVRWPRGLDCLGYRFPTEAEWEYAARAGSTTDYPCGDRPGDEAGCLEGTAWIRETSGDELQPVGRLLPNAFGLYDVIGNAWEWVWDRYDAYPPEPQVDPTGPEQGDYHIRRGCSYASTPSACYSATRNTYSRAGLRPARSVP